MMILLLSSVFPPEPVVSASIVYDLAVALSKKWDVKVVTPKPSRPMGFSFKEEYIENEGFEHIVLHSFTYPKSKIIGRMLESFIFGKHAAKYIKRNRKEIRCIYLNTWPLLAQYLIVKASKKYSIPSVIHVQDIYPESLLDKLPLFKRLIFKFLLPIDKYIQKNSSKVITISPKMKNILFTTRNMEENKIDVVHNWQNEEKFIEYRNSEKKEPKSSCFTFMFLGNLNRTAAVDVLISAFKVNGTKNSRLVIAGTGSERGLLLSLADNKQGVNIEFWDAPIIRVPEIQDRADVLLLTLKKDAAQFALPSKLMAYMFSAKPIIACVNEESDTANAIKQANCGWVVPPEDIVALAAAMKTVASIPHAELICYGRNGFNYALENYSKKKNLQKMVSIIDKLITT
jgi:glycosyltransferase involved in cell wall biosynthesis